jgi:RNA polymerase sigma factor (sigma-70 family)
MGVLGRTRLAKGHFQSGSASGSIVYPISKAPHSSSYEVASHSMKRVVLSHASEELVLLEDPELVELCLRSREDAWEALVRRYQRLIYSIPLRARLSRDDAADIFQSVCLKLYEKLSTLREHQKISAWLITTTTRECWRVSNRNRRETSSTNADGEGNDELAEIASTTPLADEQREALERQQAVRQGLDALSERCRDLLTMLFYQKDDLSYADIARRMKMPIPSVGPTRARCLEKLKKLLESKI